MQIASSLVLTGGLALGCSEEATSTVEATAKQASAYALQDSSFVYDSSTQCTVGGLQMHCCPQNDALIGVRVDQNVFKCAPLLQGGGLGRNVFFLRESRVRKLAMHQRRGRPSERCRHADHRFLESGAILSGLLGRRCLQYGERQRPGPERLLPCVDQRHSSDGDVDRPGRECERTSRARRGQPQVGSIRTATAFVSPDWSSAPGWRGPGSSTTGNIATIRI
jgi:hypothetical protein